MQGDNTMKKSTAQKLPHSVPRDIRETLATYSNVKEKWETLTPLARNEWICWVTFVKKKETRAEHLVRLREDLVKGKRRPCCWPGCPHRISNAQKWFNRLK